MIAKLLAIVFQSISLQFDYLSDWVSWLFGYGSYPELSMRSIIMGRFDGTEISGNASMTIAVIAECCIWAIIWLIQDHASRKYYNNETID